VNDGVAVAELAAAARVAVGPDSVCGTEQSLGGEDFGWMLEKVPGALARLGVRAPGGPVHDLHQADFDIDERAIDVGVRLLATVAAAARPAA
jgi:amidohydrolase